MVDHLKEEYPGIADGLVPEKISYIQVLKKLQKEIQEKGTIRDLIHILQQMEEDLNL